MTRPMPFSLRIFVADGDPDGLRIVERSNWIGKAIVFPRALYTKVRDRLEFQQTGVYLLLGPRDGEAEKMIYIGEGDPVRPRLESHYAKRDFWTRAVFFVTSAGQLNKAHVQYLESELITRAKIAKRAILDNANSPTQPTLTEADRADMDVFLEYILGMLPVLGIYAFEKSSAPEDRTDNDSIELKCQGRGITAIGYETSQGFIVLKGSQAAITETDSLIHHNPSLVELRTELCKNGVLLQSGEHFVFTQDYTFSSPSYAASVVLGRQSNGRECWKDVTGRTLKEIQQTQSSLESIQLRGG